MALIGNGNRPEVLILFRHSDIPFHNITAALRGSKVLDEGCAVIKEPF